MHVRLTRVHERSEMETRVLTPDDLRSWTIPPFQRPLKINEKMRTIAKELRDNGGFISGVLSIGRIAGDENEYLFDGQHRREAALMSEMPEFIADVRYMSFSSLAEMSDEFVKLNSSIVKMNSDDILRGLEGNYLVLQMIRKLPFVGYDQIRRGASSPVVSASVALRCWYGSQFDIPQTSAVIGAAGILDTMDIEDARGLISFLQVANSAWGDSHNTENRRLWGALNLSLCMWMWRKVVVDTHRGGGRRVAVLTPDLFKKCLMSLSAGDYADWLVGRNQIKRDRSPAYMRLKTAFAQRLRAEGHANTVLPAPQWASK